MKRSLRSLRPCLVRLTAATTLAAFLAAAVGYPVWSPGEGKDLSTPFPCMYRQCGCRTAQQCFQGCCCFTNAEKVAWARKNSVQVPGFVVAAAAKESQSCDAAEGGCRAPQTSPCCSTKATVAASGAGAAKTRAQTAGKLRRVSAIEALTCQGHVDQWVSLGAIDVAHPDFWQLELLAAGSVAILIPASDSPSFAPPSPPPWC